MSTVKKGVLTASKEWAKHLRPDGRRRFWSAELRLRIPSIRPSSGR